MSTLSESSKYNFRIQYQVRLITKLYVAYASESRRHSSTRKGIKYCALSLFSGRSNITDVEY